MEEKMKTRLEEIRDKSNHEYGVLSLPGANEYVTDLLSIIDTQETEISILRGEIEELKADIDYYREEMEEYKRQLPGDYFMCQ